MKKLSQYALFVACCGLIGMAVGTAIKATCGTSIWHLAMVATGVAEPDYEAIVDRIFYGLPIKPDRRLEGDYRGVYMARKLVECERLTGTQKNKLEVAIRERELRRQIELIERQDRKRDAEYE